eukprot:11376811-Alexandrium_andersonii.AAC.1
MSASLVGSEMCIRDRHSLLEGASLPVLNDCCKQQRRHPGNHAICRGAQPVSYTHLTLPTICSV